MQSPVCSFVSPTCDPGSFWLELWGSRVDKVEGPFTEATGSRLQNSSVQIRRVSLSIRSRFHFKEVEAAWSW